MQDRQNAGMRWCHASVRAFLYLCLAVSLASGCVRARARTTPDAPPLDVPLPPPRLVEAAEPPPPQPMTLPPEPASSALPARPPAPPAPPQQAESSKPEAPKAPEPEEPKPSPSTPTTLRTTPTQQEALLERRIRGLLLEATSNLNRIDYGRLNTDAKGQYDSAKAFVRQADDALRTKNLVFASYLADKAATLATQLR